MVSFFFFFWWGGCLEEERALQVFAFTLRGEIARELKNNFTYEDEEESTTLHETWGNSDGWEDG